MRYGNTDAGIPVNVTKSNTSDIWKSGSRIKVKKLVTTDGAVQFLGFYDTKLQIDCRISTYGVDNYRCLPSSVAPSGIFYSDPLCANKLFYSYIPVGTIGSRRPDYGYIGGNTVDQSQDGFYEIAAAYTGTLYLAQGDDCIEEEEDSSVYETYDYYSVGAKVPLETFQAASLQIE